MQEVIEIPPSAYKTIMDTIRIYAQAQGWEFQSAMELSLNNIPVKSAP